MKIVALTDIHGNLRYLNDIIPHLKDTDLTVIAGDITNFGDRYNAEMVINPIKEYSNNILAVYGNCDYPTVENFIEELGISIAWNWRKVDDYIYVGLGGSLSCPARTPGEYTDDRYMKFLESVKTNLSSNSDRLILITHEPPRDTICDRAYSGAHVGSNSIRTFIEEVQPLLVITGHIHEGRGVDKIGRSIIVNPGPFRRGDYAIILIDGLEVVITLKP